mgnify:FL=1
MNKIYRLLTALAAAVLLAAGAVGASLAADAEQVTAAEAKTHSSESWVMLEGYVVESIGNERYQFKDDSGEIEVHIEPEEWRMHKVSKDTRVRILGQLKKRGDRIEVKADRVAVVD